MEQVDNNQRVLDAARVLAIALIDRDMPTPEALEALNIIRGLLLCGVCNGSPDHANVCGGEEAHGPDQDHSDDVCPTCGDPDCSRPWGHPVEYK